MKMYANNDYCHVEGPEEFNKILWYNQGEKSVNILSEFERLGENVEKYVLLKMVSHYSNVHFGTKIMEKRLKKDLQTHTAFVKTTLLNFV